jgi:hypothetical protein
MRIFLSYASEERPLAERVCRVLETEGHEVFFDRDDLGGGDAFGERIRTAIESSQVLVYLISHHSVASHSYALTELAIAATLAKKQRPAILPVRLDDTPIDAVPPTLRAYTILEPQGDAPAEIALAVDRIRKQRQAAAMRLAAVAAGVVLVVAGALAFTWRSAAAPTPEPKPEPRPPQPEAVTPRDPVEALNDAILKRTPAQRRVTLTGMPGNNGWSAVLILADRTATQVSYRLDGESAFTDTGSTGIPNAMTGRPLPNTTIQLTGPFWRKRTLAVKYVDAKGQENGPYDLEFDPRSEFLRFTKQALAAVGWLTFQEQSPGQRIVYFTTLLSFKAAFKEIRYSFDSPAVDRAYPLATSASDVWPARMDGDQLFMPVPAGTKFITVKVVYVDGTMDTRRYDVP